MLNIQWNLCHRETITTETSGTYILLPHFSLWYYMYVQLYHSICIVFMYVYCTIVFVLYLYILYHCICILFMYTVPLYFL